MDKVATLSSATDSINNPGQITLPLPKTEELDGPILYVSRHGESEYNARKLFCGIFDSPLTPKGVGDAEKQAALLKDKDIDIGITNDLQRSKRTLEEILKFHPDTRIEIDANLRERDYGNLTGKNKKDLAEKDPEMTLKFRRSWDFPPPNGESLKMVWENRIKPFCEKLEQRIKQEKINVLVVCTNNTMRLIRMHFEKLTIEGMLEIENPFDDYASYKIED